MEDKNQILSSLLKNLLNASPHFMSSFIYDREGLVVASESRLENSEANELILGAITTAVNSALQRIGKEYEISQYSTGSFETSEFRLVFVEAGKQCIFLSVSDYELSLNQVLPMMFLVAEKINRIVSNELFEGFTIDIPDLEIEKMFDPCLVNNVSEETGVLEEMGLDINYKLIRPLTTIARYKIIVLGDAQVGKTSLIGRFASNAFKENYMPTLGISITEQEYVLLDAEKSSIKFMIWDLAGQKYFRRARKAYISGSQAALLVFDVTSRDSFNALTEWYNDVIAELPMIPFIIVANKIDLQKERVISEVEGRKLASDLKCSYIETSAKTGIHVRETFQLLGIGLFFHRKEPNCPE
jgi:small GTP-binding protein